MPRGTIALLVGSLLVFGAIGCRRETAKTANPPETLAAATPNPNAAADPAPTDEPEPEDEAPGVPSADVLALAKGNNEFAFDLYARLARRDGNLAFSPYSISSALAMTYAGARGPTADEMRKVLRFPLEGEQLHTAFADLNRRLPGGGKPHQRARLLLANSLWGQRGYPFREEFLRLTQTDYGAEPHEVDFVGDTEGARGAINDWVEQHTEKMIRELLKPGTLTPDSRLVLANAVYFQGLWATPFLTDQTKEAPFHVSAKETVRSPMMHLTDDFRYFEGDGVQVLELPYRGQRWSMIVILPQKPEGLAAVEDGLTAQRVEGWLAKLARYEVIVTLPKFTATADFSLGGELKEMGMPLAFSGAADFSGMTDEHASDGERLRLSDVVHQARVEVTEEGTKADAATAALMKRYTGVHDPSPKATFQADHSFLFLIEDRTAQDALFFGRVLKP